MGWTPAHCAAFHGRLGCLQVSGRPYDSEWLQTRIQGRWNGWISTPLFLSPSSIMLMHRPQTPQPGFGSITLLQKFTPHFKILDPCLDWLLMLMPLGEWALFLNSVLQHFWSQSKWLDCSDQHTVNIAVCFSILIHWIVIYLVNSAIHYLNNWSQCNVQFTINIHFVLPLQSIHFLTFFFFIICSFFPDGVQV